MVRKLSKEKNVYDKISGKKNREFNDYFFYIEKNKFTNIINNYENGEDEINKYLLGILGICLYKFKYENKIFLGLVDKSKDSLRISKLSLEVYGDMTIDSVVSSIKEFSKEEEFQEAEELPNEIITMINEDIENVTGKYSSNLYINFEVSEEEIMLHFHFTKDIYSGNFIKSLFKYYESVINELLIDNMIKIKNINNIKNSIGSLPDSKEELFESVYDSFVAQVRLNENEVAIENDGEKITYKELLDKTLIVGKNIILNSTDDDLLIAVVGEVSIDYLVVILSIIRIGGTFIPISNTNPKDRIISMLINAKCKNVICLNDEDKQQFIKADINVIDMSRLFESNNKIVMYENIDMSKRAYIIFTSGSTGYPKGVQVSQRNLSNYINYCKNEYCKDLKPVMPLFSSIGVDLTITSTFLPLTVGGKIKIYNCGNMIKAIESIAADNEINLIKSTPSQMSILLATKMVNEGIKKIILGGEALKSELVKDIQEMYGPNIEIFNEYGPTEATVGCMIYKCTENEDSIDVPLGIAINNCRIYILDKDLKNVPVCGMGEIVIAGKCVSLGYVNDDINNDEYFMKDIIDGEEIAYRTGDLAIRLPNNIIEYKGRIDNQLKVRGMRVEVSEIERNILKLPNIKRTIVSIIKDDMDNNRIVCVIESDKEKNDFKKLKASLQEYLPDYMIPDFFIDMKDIPLNENSGKIDIKNVKDILKKLEEKDEYKGEDYIEQKLIDIWKEVLGVDSISKDEDFFDAGGQSLNIATLAGKIYSEFSVMIELGEFFENRKISQQVNLIKAERKNEIFKIEPAEEKDYYEVSSSQKRIYIFNEFNKNKIVYNTPFTYIADGNLDVNKFEAAINKLIERHESLRTSFHFINGGIYQKINEKVDFKVETDELIEGQEEEIIKKFVRPFDLTKAPLMRLCIAKYKDNHNKNLFILDMHHTITDGMSMNIFLRDLQLIYNGLELGDMPLQYKDFSEWQNNMINSGKLKDQEEYWRKVFEKDVKDMNLPFDYEPELISYKGSIYNFSIDKELCDKINSLCKINKITIHIFLLGIFNILLSKYGKVDDIVVSTATAGRVNESLNNIIGVFINMVAIRSNPSEYKSFKEYLNEMRELSIKALDNSELPFEKVAELIPNKKNVLDVMFTTQDFGNPEIVVDGVQLNSYKYKYELCHSKLNMIIGKIQPDICGSVEYSVELFKEETIKELVENFKHLINEFSEDMNRTIGDVDLLQKRGRD